MAVGTVQQTIACPQQDCSDFGSGGVWLILLTCGLPHEPGIGSSTATAPVHSGTASVQGTALSLSLLLFSPYSHAAREVLILLDRGGRAVPNSWNGNLSQGSLVTRSMPSLGLLRPNTHILTSRCLGHMMAALHMGFNGHSYRKNC